MLNGTQSSTQLYRDCKLRRHNHIMVVKLPRSHALVACKKPIFCVGFYRLMVGACAGEAERLTLPCLFSMALPRAVVQ
jgi:hypothetical protein